MDNLNIIREILLFENREILFSYRILTLDNYKDVCNKAWKEYSPLNDFLTNKFYYMMVCVDIDKLKLFICDEFTKEHLKKDYNNKLNVYITDSDYDKKINYENGWEFRVFSEDFDLENLKKVINLKKYINNKFINNFKKVKSDLFIEYY